MSIAGTLSNDIAELHARLEKLENLIQTLTSRAELAAPPPATNVSEAGLQMRLAALEGAALSQRGNYGPKGDQPKFLKGFDNWPALLGKHYPDMFPLWKTLYNNALPFYSVSIEASCSTWQNRFAVAFRDYVSIFARGYLLDVGSGILNCPVYLEGYPPELIRGLDPREAASDTAFDIACGVNEFIPFADGSFQTVCNATSLDHVIDMEKAITENARVLEERGRLILWYADVPGSPPPPKVPRRNDDGEYVGQDEFHIFHICDAWFLPMLEMRFRLLDRRVFPSGSFSHVFAVYEKRA